MTYNVKKPLVDLGLRYLQSRLLILINIPEHFHRSKIRTGDSPMCTHTLSVLALQQYDKTKSMRHKIFPWK